MQFEQIEQQPLVNAFLEAGCFNIALACEFIRRAERPGAYGRWKVLHLYSHATALSCESAERFLVAYLTANNTASAFDQGPETVDEVLAELFNQALVKETIAAMGSKKLTVKGFVKAGNEMDKELCGDWERSFSRLKGVEDKITELFGKNGEARVERNRNRHGLSSTMDPGNIDSARDLAICSVTTSWKLCCGIFDLDVEAKQHIKEAIRCARQGIEPLI